MNIRLAIAGSLALGLFVARTASAETIAYVVDNGTTGTQDWTGSLGLDFDVVNPIYVYSLGVFDSNQDGLSVPLVARIYDRQNPGTPLVTVNFAAGDTGTLIGGSRFLPLPCPLALPAGFQGTIEADGYGGTELNGNTGGPSAKSTNDGGGAITFLGGGRYGTDPSVFPTIVDGGPANRYAAGTFAFATACANDAACTNADHPKCGTGGVCGKATGAFFPSCAGATAACNTTTATCEACNGDFGAVATKTCGGPARPACVAGACLECSVTKTCASAATPACSAAGSCVVCTADNGAASGDKCPTSGNPYCKVDGTCGQCTTNADCAGRAGKPYCAADGSCTSSCDADNDCGVAASGQVCDDNSKLCVAGCRGASGNGCPLGQVCSSTTATKGTCSPAPIDAGTTTTSSSSSGGSDSGAGSSSGNASSSGGAADAGGTGSSSGDSGCSVTTSSESSLASWLTAFGLGAFVLSAMRRKRR